MPALRPWFLWLALAALLGAALLGGLRSGPRALGGQILIEEPFDQPLVAGQSVGQSFVARHSGLAGVELLLAPAATDDGTVVATLYGDEPRTTALAVARLPLSAQRANGTLRLPLAPAFFSDDQRYHLDLRIEGGSAVLRGASALSYLEGARYLEGAPQEAQLRFMPLYSPAGLLFDAVALVGGSALACLGYLLLFGLPGAALLSLLAPTLLRDPRQALILAPVTGVALTPLLYVAGWLLRFPIHRGTLALGLVLSLALLARQWAARWAARAPAIALDPLRDGTLLLVVLLLAVSRFAAIADLEGPSWGDSVQHTVMSQLLDDHNGLFSDWLPYAPYRTQTTHFGFPAATTLVMELTGAPATRATLGMGQWMNLLAILSLYPLVVRATRQPWAGIGALVAAGLLSPMPAMYVNWGRYAQLSGQVVLPLALLLLMESFDGAHRRRMALLLGIVLAGMSLHYYRMPVYFLWFAVAWGLLYALPAWGRQRAAWRRALTLALIAALPLALVLGPWALRVADSSLSQLAAAGVTRAPPTTSIWVEYQQWRTLPFFAPLPLLLAASAALLAGLWRRARWPLLIALWTLFLAATRATQLIRFPLANMLDVFATLIMLYLPLGLLVGWGVGEVGARLRAARREGALALGLLLLAVVGSAQQGTIASPEHVLLTRSDTIALAWARQALPADARVLVNGFAIYGDSTMVGSDGGWWLPLLSGRANTMPPQYALKEAPIEADYTQRMLDLVLTLRDADLGDPAALAPLCAEGITHIYSGQREGLVGTQGPQQLLQPAELEANPTLRRIYQLDQTRFYELGPDSCPAR